MYASHPPDVTQRRTNAPKNAFGKLRRLACDLLHLIAPSPCLACGARFDSTHDALGLCPSCREDLEIWPDSGCELCQRPIAGAHLPGGYRCGPCRRRPPSFDRLRSLWSYQGPLDSALLALKFRRLEYLGPQFGHRLAQHFKAEAAEAEVVVPVPLHWRRRWERGYDQAHLIAKALARSTNRPLCPALRRTRATSAQSRLPRKARQANLRGAFEIRRHVEGVRVLLVDDVVTTGSTLEAACQSLRSAGARSIVALTVARTPEPE